MSKIRIPYSYPFKTKKLFFLSTLLTQVTLKLCLVVIYLTIFIYSGLEQSILVLKLPKKAIISLSSLNN
jgi:hypothetical protein